MTKRDEVTPEARKSLGRRAGLCARCDFLRTLGNRKGSVFVFCWRSQEDAAFTRYPPLPVLSCRGFRDWLAPEADSGRES
ncbi:MAG: hypothetical protein K0U98_19685 [Deltaproteobacteria bacterium]|nr:hypothetical protein [Deltaproteobacteria bacterium]